YVDGRGYLNFIFPSSPDTAEFDGKNGTVHFPNSFQEVEIGVRADTAEKTYLLDCTVKGPGPCYECFFSIDGPDGQSQIWQMSNSDWRHLLFTLNPGDTQWYVLKLKGRQAMTFKSCDVMEVP